MLQLLGFMGLKLLCRLGWLASSRTGACVSVVMTFFFNESLCRTPMADAEKKPVEESSSSYEESVEAEEDTRPRDDEPRAAPEAPPPPPPPPPAAGSGSVPEPNDPPRDSKQAWSAARGNEAKGKGKGKIGKGKTRKEKNFCEHCWSEVGDHQSSKDQHQYWSIECLRWQRFNQGMDWDEALAAAHRMKNRREERHNQALRSRAEVSLAGHAPPPAGRDHEENKKTEKKKAKKEKKEHKRRKSPSPDLVKKKKSSKRDPSDPEDSPEGRVPKLVRHGKNAFLIQFT